MSLIIRKIQQKEETQYDAFVADHPYTSFFQTRAWGDFQNHVPGRKNLGTFGIFKNEKLAGTALIIRHALPFGWSWLYTPRGPLLDWHDEKAVKVFADFMRTLARKEKALFWRVDPFVTVADQNASIVERNLKLIGARSAHASFQPEYTRMVDLTIPEEEILKQMKQKGRYNIRLAAKKGVIVEETKDATVFATLMQETATRDGFSAHTEKIYQDLLKDLSKTPKAHLFVAFSAVKIPLAAAIVIIHGTQATYLYGASSNQSRELMAPYLLHWEIMRFARQKGCTKYDFFGVAPENEPDHSWRGVTEFKEKFGGGAVRYIAAREVIYGFLRYCLFAVIKKVR